MASGYSLQYGASHPHVLVERAAEQEMDTLALTDRDGTYGAVKFAKACRRAGIRPVLGVNLAYRPPGVPSRDASRKTPVAAARSATCRPSAAACRGRRSWPPPTPVADGPGGRRCAG